MMKHDNTRCMTNSSELTENMEIFQLKISVSLRTKAAIQKPAKFSIFNGLVPCSICLLIRSTLCVGMHGSTLSVTER